jgi:hypothetical protein
VRLFDWEFPSPALTVLVVAEPVQDNVQEEPFVHCHGADPVSLNKQQPRPTANSASDGQSRPPTEVALPTAQKAVEADGPIKQAAELPGVEEEPCTEAKASELEPEHLVESVMDGEEKFDAGSELIEDGLQEVVATGKNEIKKKKKKKKGNTSAEKPLEV